MYGFNPTLGSDYFNKGSSNNSGSSNSDWKTDWNTVGDYSGLSGVPFGSFDYSSNKRKDAVNLALDWLGAGTNKYKKIAEREYPGAFTQQPKNSTGGGSWQQIAQDISVFNPAPTAPYTIAGGQSEATWGQKLGDVALKVAPFTGPAAPFVAGAGAIASLF